MNYLELVNKVIDESASEQDQLTSGTWSSAEAGRRIYPRIKRNVADAWKNIQMMRNEWEFMTAEFSSVIYPRLSIKDGNRAAGSPPVGATFVGADSDFVFTVKQVITTGDWTTGTAEGVIEFETYTGNRVIPGEVFVEATPVSGDGEFTYLGKGGYDFTLVEPYLREIQWATFSASVPPGSASPVVYLPYDNWFYNEYTYGVSSQSGPSYVSQDYKGDIVFYPQTFNPFRIRFVHYLAPQVFSDWDDEPTRLPEEYHDWIAWEALKMFASHDKNPPLERRAAIEAFKYRFRAERNMMPLISRRPSAFNE
jgi:hypothetical protein